MHRYNILCIHHWLKYSFLVNYLQPKMPLNITIYHLIMKNNVTSINHICLSTENSSQPSWSMFKNIASSLCNKLEKRQYCATWCKCDSVALFGSICGEFHALFISYADKPFHSFKVLAQSCDPTATIPSLSLLPDHSHGINHSLFGSTKLTLTFC